MSDQLSLGITTSVAKTKSYSAPTPPTTYAARTCTTLTDDVTRIYVTYEGRKRFAGQLDRTLRIYQLGTNLGTQVYWNCSALKQPIVFGIDEWDQIKDAAIEIEFYDEKSNATYLISTDHAKTHGRVIETPNGPRYGIALGCWGLISNTGNMNRKGDCGE